MHARAAFAVVMAVVCLDTTARGQRPPATTATTQPGLAQEDLTFLEQSNQQLTRQKNELQELSREVTATPPASRQSQPLHSTSAIVPSTGVDEISPLQPSSHPAANDASDAQQGNVVVTSDREFNRNAIAPALGADTYSLGRAQIDATPGGEDATFQQVLLRAPGVVEDSYGQVHVRGEHANLTYRVNGVLLPEGLNAFGQELDTRLIDSVTLIDGSLPAQFGFRTAGIVDVNTKTGDMLRSNEVSLYGGSQNTFQPSVQLGGVQGKLDYFVTVSANHNDLGIENTTGDAHALHDRTNQERLFGYSSYLIDSTSRVSLLVNAAAADFEIPDTSGVAPVYPLAGHSRALTADSSGINENQNEQQYYAVLAYQKTMDQLSLQAAVFTRYGAIHFTPDPVNDLIFQGVAGNVRNTFLTNGAQLDAAHKISDAHTIRFGLIADYTTERLATVTGVFASDPTRDVVTTIADDSGNHGISAGLYLQDEWRINQKLTLNYGGRYDRFDTNFTDNGQLSPRINLVYKLDSSITFHAGYARYFVPPPLQYVGPGTVNKFNNTTNASANNRSGPLKVERSSYYDLGISKQVTTNWKVNLDGFYKDAHNLVDNGQFGAPVIITPFNYRLGQVYGAELSCNYTRGPWSVFQNISYVSTLGKDVISQQYLFANDELAYIHSHYIKLDHEAEYTASVGISHTLKNDLFYVDALYGSGLRRGFVNTGKEPEYFPVNAGYQHTFRIEQNSKNTVKLRLDILNIFNESYQLRDGSGIGVAAPQYGARRSFLVGITYAF